MPAYVPFEISDPSVGGEGACKIDACDVDARTGVIGSSGRALFLYT